VTGDTPPRAGPASAAKEPLEPSVWSGDSQAVAL
jgi:hypothetical protein